MGGWKNVHCVLIMEFIMEFIPEFPLKWNKTGWQWETESIYLIPRMNLWLWELVAKGWFGLTSGEWDVVCRHGPASPSDGVCSESCVLRRFHLQSLKSVLSTAPSPSDNILWDHYVCGLSLTETWLFVHIYISHLLTKCCLIGYVPRIVLKLWENYCVFVEVIHLDYYLDDSNKDESEPNMEEMILIFPMSSVTPEYGVYPCSSTCISFLVSLRFCSPDGRTERRSSPCPSKVLPGKQERLWDNVSW